MEVMTPRSPVQLRCLLAMGLLCQLWDAVKLPDARSPQVDTFIQNVMSEAPDLTGERRQKAAKRLAEAKMLLEEALEFKAAGVPGKGLWYKIVTEGEDGIGIRKAPRMDAPRVEDLMRGSIFGVDDVVEKEGQPIWLHLEDGRGWVFDLTPVDPDTPTVQRIENAYDGKTIEELEAEVEAAKLEFDRIRGGLRNS